MRIPFRGAHVLLAPLATVLIAACGGDSNSPTAPPVDEPPVAAATVDATPSLSFTPNRVTLIAGGTVTFDFGAVEHDVFFDNAPAGAPQNITAPSANKAVALTFATPGTFVYNCHIHPGMTGTVIVKAPTA